MMRKQYDRSITELHIFTYIHIYLRLHNCKSEVSALKRFTYMLLEVENEMTKVFNNPTNDVYHRQKSVSRTKAN